MPAPRDPDENLVVQFRYLAMENATKSLDEGRPIFDDVEVCEIRYPGSREVKFFPSTAFSHWNEDRMTGTQTKITYAERFSRQYQQFKSKTAQTVSGTPLEYARFLTDGRRAELRAQNVYTVEMLAAIDGTELKNLGPGGRDMKNRAIEYIEKTKEASVDTRLLHELQQAQARNEVLEEDNKRLRETAGGSEFEEMSVPQLREYITVNTGKEPHGNLPRKTLVRMAVEATPNKAA